MTPFRIALRFAYPMTAIYLGAVGVVVAVANDQLAVLTGVVALGLLVALVLLIATRREVTVVHHLVNSQRDELLERIDQLIAALHDAGIPIPPGKDGEPPEDQQRSA